MTCVLSPGTAEVAECERIRAGLSMAYKFAQEFSDDLSTNNGAVVVQHDNVIGWGCNRLPRGVNKTPERLARPKKYAFTEHAERSAIYCAAENGVSTIGATMYCPWFACADCARAIILAGISKVIGHKQMFDRTPDHWKESIADGDVMLAEAGVKTAVYDGPIGDVSVLMNGETWNP